MLRITLTTSLLLVATLSLFTPFTSADPTYSVAPVADAIPGLMPNAINESGQIVGNVGTTPYVVTGGVPQALPFVGNANDINDLGAIVGKAKSSVDNRYKACVYANGSLSLLDESTASESTAYGINNAGTYVGNIRYLEFPGPPWSYGFSISSTGFHYAPANFGEDSATAFAVNDSGTIAGTRLDLVPSGFIYTAGPDTHLNSLLPAPYSSSGARDVSNSGLVVGSMDSSTAPAHAYLYILNGIRDLGALAGDSDALAVNTWGAVVGFSEAAGGVTHAILWEHGVLYDLNDLIPAHSEWTLHLATDINDAGQIVGVGRRAGHATDDGFVLTPGQAPVSDCNANGIADIYDILAGTSSDALGDLIPDECASDDDHDSIPDITDNCPRVANADQDDFDGDGAGDACDDDMDDDGVVNALDACNYTPRRALVEADGSVLGDVDGDCDVDLVDFQIMQTRFTGPSGRR